MFFYFKWYIKKRTSYTGLEERQSELAQLISEIDRITDRDSQLVEDRVNKLKTLLHEIDNRIALYEKDLEELSQREKNPLSEKPKNETLYTSLGRGIRAALATADKPAEPAPSRPQIPIEAIANLRLINNNSVDFIPEATGSPPADREVAPNNIHTDIQTVKQASKSPSKRQIRTSIDILINEGLSPPEIASRLDISIAEVNLAMNLRRKK